MIRRLIEANYAQHREAPSDEQIQFWLLESRTPEMLVEIAARYAEAAQAAAKGRPLLVEAIAADRKALRHALANEQEAEREGDRSYWEPLKREMEQLRHDRK